jgi:hypothetical protein
MSVDNVHGDRNMEVSKYLRPLLQRIAILAGVLVAFTLIINLSWFDEELNPDLARMLPPQPVSMEDNAFPLVYGFLAANDRDPRAAGMEIIATLRQRFAAGERATLSADEIDEILGNPAPARNWSDLFASMACNPRFEIDCPDRLIDDLAAGGVSDTRLKVLLDRLETVFAMSRFEENQEYDAYTPTPSYGMMSIARIRLARSFNEKTTLQFLDDVTEELRFWKTMLRDGQTLIAKMIALAGLRNSSQFLSALMRERNLSPGELARIGEVLTPMTDDERDIGETFLAEFRLAALSDKSFAVLLEGPSGLTQLALQDNATYNEFYQTITLPLRFRAALSAPEFFEQGAYEDLSYNFRAFPPPLYNLGGKLTLKYFSSQIGMTGYISRVHDIEGRIALVLLQAEILANPGRRVESVIAASQHRNPYTLEPMDYDPATSRISFPCLDRGGDICAVALNERGF